MSLQGRRDLEGSKKVKVNDGFDSHQPSRFDPVGAGSNRFNRVGSNPTLVTRGFRVRKY
jgi:hypothetical protein